MLCFQVVAALQREMSFVFPGGSLGVFAHKAFCNAQCLRELLCVLFIPCTALKALHSVCLYSRQYITGSDSSVSYDDAWIQFFHSEGSSSTVTLKSTYTCYCNKIYIYLICPSAQIALNLYCCGIPFVFTSKTGVITIKISVNKDWESYFWHIN